MRIAVDPSLQPADYSFVHRIRVRFAETDAMSVVHHSRYLPYLEEARVAYLRAIDHPYSEWRENGLDSAVIEAYVHYRRPLRFDDELDVHVVLAGASRATFQMAYLVTVGVVACATAVTVHGMVTADGRPTRLPSWLVELAGSPSSRRSTPPADSPVEIRPGMAQNRDENPSSGTRP